MTHGYQWLLGVALALWPPSAHALPNDRDVYITIGLGAASCEYWTNARRQEETLGTTPRGSWVLGYITAVNLFGPWSFDVTQSIDTKGIWAWIDNYCAEHPFDSIAVAAQSLVSELGRSTARAPPEQHGTSPVPLGTNDAAPLNR
jgi:hypothetical protein